MRGHVCGCAAEASLARSKIDAHVPSQLYTVSAGEIDAVRAGTRSQFSRGRFSTFQTTTGVEPVWIYHDRTTPHMRIGGAIYGFSILDFRRCRRLVGLACWRMK